MRVMVTGAGGHIGQNLVPALVAAGHVVRASVRPGSGGAALPRLQGAEVIELDVRDASAFAAAARGAEVIVHLAATYRLWTGSRAADAEMLRDSIEGARAAMEAAAAAAARVVFASSVVAVPLRRPGEPPATEADWQNDLRVPYVRAKTEAERLAWQLAETHRIRLATLLPAAVIGPGFVKRTASTDTIEAIMLGAMRHGTFNANLPLIDVRDVVAAFVRAVERDRTGRYLVTDTFPSFMALSALMHQIDPSVPAAPRLLPRVLEPLGPMFDWLEHRRSGAPRSLTPEVVASMRGKVWSASNARARAELDWAPRVPLEQSLADTMARIREIRSGGPSVA